jgi:hypothetical protein
LLRGCFLGLLLLPGGLLAQSPTRDHIVLDLSMVDPEDKQSRLVHLCFCSGPAFSSGFNSCDLHLMFELKDKSLKQPVGLICDRLKEKGKPGVTTMEWAVSLSHRSKELAWSLDCGTRQDISPNAIPPAEPPRAAKPGKDAAPEPRARDLETRLEKKIEELRKELLKRLSALEEAQRRSCVRLEANLGGRREVMVLVAGGVLRFVEVLPGSEPVPIGLSRARADELERAAQRATAAPRLPRLLLAVTPETRSVGPFFVQDRLIDPELFRRLVPAGRDARAASYQDADALIAELERRCGAKADFALPSEEQFVALARQLHDSALAAPRPCAELASEVGRLGVAELLGTAWQWTSSACRAPEGSGFDALCPADSYILKGGAASSEALECLPEYRGALPLDVRRAETSFRLILEG